MSKIKSINEYFDKSNEYFYKVKISDDYIKLMRNLNIPENKFIEVYSLFMDEITNDTVVQFTFDDWVDNEDNYFDFLN